MILTLILFILQSSAQQPTGVDEYGAPPIRYILDQPEVLKNMKAANKGCLARRTKAICDCYMRNFRFKVNGRDVDEAKVAMAVDISWRRNEAQYDARSGYDSLNDLLVRIETACAANPQWTMDIDPEDLAVGAKSASKKPASVKPVKAK